MHTYMRMARIYTCTIARLLLLVLATVLVAAVSLAHAPFVLASPLVDQKLSGLLRGGGPPFDVFLSPFS